MGRIGLILGAIAVVASCKAEPPQAENSLTEMRLNERTAIRYYYFSDEGLTPTTEYETIPVIRRAGVFAVIPKASNHGTGRLWAVYEDEQGLFARVEPREVVALRAYITQRPYAIARAVAEEARVMTEATPGSQALEAEAKALDEATEKLGRSPFGNAGFDPAELMRARRSRWARVRVPEPKDYGLE